MGYIWEREAASLLCQGSDPSWNPRSPNFKHHTHIIQVHPPPGKSPEDGGQDGGGRDPERKLSPDISGTARGRHESNIIKKI